MDNELIVQYRNAFDFIDKLFFEISYLIKEIEGILQQEKENFAIGRPSGYQVTTRTSAGLEPVSVAYWAPKTFSVFFGPGEKVRLEKGQTITKFDDNTRLLLIHISVNEKGTKEPILYAGCIDSILAKNPSKQKFEYLMFEFSYNSKKVFSTFPKVEFEDAHCKLKGRFFKLNLFSIKNTKDIESKVIKKMLQLYRT